MVTEGDLMKIIRNGIADAFAEEEDKSSTEQSAAPLADEV